MRRTEYLQLTPECDLPNLQIEGPFCAIVLVEVGVSDEWQMVVSDWLVRLGCLYMMAWGESCSTWDCSVDYAFQQLHPIPEDWNETNFVVTTWHDNEPMSEVFFFAENCAWLPFEDEPRTPLLILDITQESRRAEILAANELAITRD